MYTPRPGFGRDRSETEHKYMAVFDTLASHMSYMLTTLKLGT